MHVKNYIYFHFISIDFYIKLYTGLLLMHLIHKQFEKSIIPCNYLLNPDF